MLPNTTGDSRTRKPREQGSAIKWPLSQSAASRQHHQVFRLRLQYHGKVKALAMPPVKRLEF